MTEIQFFPAAMVGHFNKFKTDGSGDHLKFWGDKAIFNYDKVLYSSFYMKEKYKKLKEGESFFKSIGFDGIKMLDSGGFQVRTLGIELTPEEVIQTYEREQPHIGFILDEPLTKEFSSEMLETNYKYVKYMAEQKFRLPDTELLNISHGMGLTRKKIHYETLKEFNNVFDGWANGSPKKLRPIFHAWAFMYLYENDITLKDKRFHFLGLTGNMNMPFIFYLAKLNLVKYISFDSTKYGREGIMADIRNPSFMQERLSIGKMAKGHLKSNKFCPCPVCQKTPMEIMKKDVNYAILHNLYWEIKKFEFFDAFETAEDLKNYVMDSKHFPEKTKTAIRFIDYALENGVDNAEKKFKEHFVMNEEPIIKPLSF